MKMVVHPLPTYPLPLVPKLAANNKQLAKFPHAAVASQCGRHLTLAAREPFRRSPETGDVDNESVHMGMPDECMISKTMLKNAIYQLLKHK